MIHQFLLMGSRGVIFFGEGGEIFFVDNWRRLVDEIFTNSIIFIFSCCLLLIMPEADD